MEKDSNTTAIPSCDQDVHFLDLSPKMGRGKRGLKCLDEHARQLGCSRILDFSAAMAKIITPKTALATASATELPICSYVVATGPARPTFLIENAHEWVSEPRDHGQVASKGNKGRCCKDLFLSKPLNGWAGPHSSRYAVNPGISRSTSESPSHPNLANTKDFT